MGNVISNEITFLRRIQKEYHQSPYAENRVGDQISEEINKQIKFLNSF